MATCEESLTQRLVNIHTEDDLLTKHKKERRDLQAQIQKIKNAVPKGDKKKKKESVEQIAKLEAEMDAKQDEETTYFNSRERTDPVENETTNQNDNELSNSADDKSADTVQGKKSKAQKRRDKKQAKGKEREERIKEQDEENKLGPRQQEMMKIKAILKTKGLVLHEIPADGNCLYNAVSHQLLSLKIKYSNEELRHKTAEYMRSNKDDFLPFLTHPDTGDMLTPEEFEKYCDKTANSPMWGGQIELRALSEVLKVPIVVIQADMQPLVIGEGMEGNPVTVVYHRHVYRLGEHYNSVAVASQNEDDDEENSVLK
ncbi:deubiquitinase OTUD6B-like [Physella acuta]|uniref:deubiquitinase OTUD6B-like n=1 Tax=Physella acuta TaxID=109671 RepID=UPI0027DB968D|nr:deubiquitinase OTUD6B-like [Physella acuta]